VLRTQGGASRTKRPPAPSTASCPQAKQRGLPLLDLQALARLDHLLHTRPRGTEPRIGATGTHAPAGGSVVVGWARPDAARRCLAHPRRPFALVSPLLTADAGVARLSPRPAADTAGHGPLRPCVGSRAHAAQPRPGRSWQDRMHR